MSAAFTPEDDAAIVRLYLEWFPTRVIAECVGKTLDTVRARIDELRDSGALGDQLRLSFRAARAPVSTYEHRRVPHNAIDTKPLAFGVRPIRTWSFACREAREMNR